MTEPIEPDSPLDRALDAAVRYHFETRAEAARAIGATPLPFEEISDRSKRIVRLQLQGITEAILHTVPLSANWPDQGRFFTTATLHDSQQLHDDVRHLLLAVGLNDHARPISPHQVVNDEVLPRVVALQRFWESCGGQRNSSPAQVEAGATQHQETPTPQDAPTTPAPYTVTSDRCHDIYHPEAPDWSRCSYPAGHLGDHYDTNGRHWPPDGDPTRCTSTLHGRRCMISEGHHGTHYDGQAATW